MKKSKKAIAIITLLCAVFLGGILIIPNHILATIYQSDDANIVGTVLLPGDVIDYGTYDYSKSENIALFEEGFADKFIVAHSYLSDTVKKSEGTEAHYEKPGGSYIIPAMDDSTFEDVFRGFLKEYKDVFPSEVKDLPEDIFFYGWRIGDKNEFEYTYKDSAKNEYVNTRNGVDVYPIMVKYASDSYEIERKYIRDDELSYEYGDTSSWYTKNQSKVEVSITPKQGYRFVEGVSDGTGNKITIDIHSLSSNDELNLADCYDGGNILTIDDTYTNKGTELDNATATTVTLKEWPNGQYGILKDEEYEWQDSPIFTGLDANTKYSFKTKVEGNSIIMGQETQAIQVTTRRAADKSKATIEGLHSDGIYLDKENIQFHASEDTVSTSATGDEKYMIKGYQIDDGTLVNLSDTSIETYTNNLTAGKHKLSLVYKTVRYDGSVWKDVDDKDYSVSKDLYVANTAPKATVQSKTDHSITLKTESGYVYSRDNGTTYQDSPVFNDLESATEYTFVLATKIDDMYIGKGEFLTERTNRIIKKDDAQSASSIQGIDSNGKYGENQEITFTAKYDTGADNDPIDGDIRYAPSSWSVKTSGQWTNAPYTAISSIENAGDYTLKVVYVKQTYGTGKWTSDTSDSYTIEVPFKIEARRKANKDNATIEGLHSDGIYLDKKDIQFHASEDTVSASEIGDDKYMIKGYQIDGGTLVSLSDTSTVTYTNDLATGKHKLTLVYKTLRYDGSAWKDVDDKDYSVSKDLYIADTAPKATVLSKTDHSITLKAESGYVYSKDNGKTYQASPVFNDLKSGTVYTFVLATKIDDLYIGKGESLTVKTNKIIKKDDAQSASSIQGIELNGKYGKNQEITFTAQYDTSADHNPVHGDIRYVPLSWSVNPNGKWTNAPYTATFSIENAGDHTLNIVYVKQTYLNEMWVTDEDDNYTIKVPFVISEDVVITPPDNNVNNDVDHDDAKDQSQESHEDKKTETSDMSQMMLYSLLALSALSIAGLALLKRKKIER